MLFSNVFFRHVSGTGLQQGGLCQHHPGHLPFAGGIGSFSWLFSLQVYSMSVVEATLEPASGSQPLRDLVGELQAACKDVGDLGASLLLLSKWFTVMFHNFPFYRGLYRAIRFCSRGRGS